MAADQEVANLQVMLSANTKALTEGLSRVGAAVDQMTAQTKRGVDQAGAAFDRLGRAADLAAASMRGVFAGAVAAGSAGMTQLIQTAIGDLARLGREAEKAGVSATTLQGFQFALRQQGVEARNAGDMLSGFAGKVREASAVEVDLEKTLVANNVAIRDKSGALRPTIDVLAEFAELVRNAATREEGLALATAAFGDAGRELLPVLERGAEGIRGMERAARDAGQVIDADLIQRAKDFDAVWTATWEGFGLRAKGAIASAASALSTLYADAEKALGRLGNASLFSKLGPSADQMRAAGIEPMTRQGLADSAVNAGQKRDAGDGLFIELKPKGPRTRVVAPSAGGGRGGAAAPEESEADRAKDRLEKYLQSLQRTHAVEEARLATFGQSNAAQKAAMEIARAMPDLNRLDEESKRKLTDAITQQVTKIEESRAGLERLKLAQDGVRDAAKGMADMMTNALEDLVLNGAKAQDVMKNLAKSLASSSIKALLTGEGPLSGVFGTRGVNGAPGGLLGGLFGGLFGGLSFGGARAGGGPVAPGSAYLVGERGPEIFAPRTPGTIVPNGASGGGRSQPVINISLAANGDASIVNLVRGAVARGVAESQRGEYGRQQLAGLRAG